MNFDAYRQILLGSIAGGLAGALVMWNRRRSQVAGESKLRRLFVLIIGTTVSACAFIAFSNAFAIYPRIHAAMVMILISAWAALLNSVMPVPLPRWVLSVRASEFAILRAPWTGIRLFGAFLRSTPLRHFEPRVYLSETNRNPLTVLARVREAQRVHIWAVLFSIPWLVFWSIQGQGMLSAVGLAVHVPLNIYPILHLRYVTWRMDAYVARIGRNKNAEPFTNT